MQTFRRQEYPAADASRAPDAPVQVERFIARGSAAPTLQELCATFAFPLDRFQQQAIAAFLKGENEGFIPHPRRPYAPSEPDVPSPPSSRVRHARGKPRFSGQNAMGVGTPACVSAAGLRAWDTV